MQELILDDLIEPLKTVITKDDLINPDYENNGCICSGIEKISKITTCFVLHNVL